MYFSCDFLSAYLWQKFCDENSALNKSFLYVYAEDETDIKPAYNIQLLESFLAYGEGTYGILWNGNRSIRVPCYEKAVTISPSRYDETALYRRRVLRGQRYIMAVEISAPYYVETAF